MTNFERVGKRPRSIDFQPRFRFQFVIMLLAESRRRFGVSRQQRKEVAETFSIKSEVWRQLPQNRAQLFAQSENAGGEKVRQRRLCVAQLFHLSDKSRSFNAKYETARRLRIPPPVTRGQLQRIK